MKEVSEGWTKELKLLILSEICNKFAFYGVAYLIVLISTLNYNFSPSKAVHLFGIYMGLAFLLAMGGKQLEKRKNHSFLLIIGSSINALGAFLLAIPKQWCFLFGLLILAIGRAIFMPSTYYLLGQITHKTGHIKERIFARYFALTNVGFLAALLLLGFLQTIHFSYAFLGAGIVQLLGIIPAALLTKTKQNAALTSPQKKWHPSHLKKHEIDRIASILIMTFLSLFFWAAYIQAGSSITLFAQTYTNRFFFFFTLPTPWIIATEVVFLILFTFPLMHLYLFLRKIKSNATPAMKLALSLFFMGLCFLVMQRAAAHGERDALYGSPLYLAVAFLLMALSELFFTPFGLSLLTGESNHRYRNLVTSCWFITAGIGCYGGCLLAKLFTMINLATFFDIFTFLSLTPALLVLLFSKKLDYMRHTDFL